ncbi:MAG: glycosyltransferase, partial [Candidatus Bathyarchaeia archaeon]
KYRRIKPFLRYLYKYYREIIHYPDSEKGWKPFAVKAADKLLQNEKIDAIISSSSPVTAHIIARELKAKYKIPWIADFRDLWTQNHNYPYSRIRKYFERKLELKTLATADVLIAVSPFDTEKLKTLHKGKKVHTITNGFDPDKVNNGKTPLTAKFTITYTGQIYPKQDPSKFLIALKNLISKKVLESKDIDVRFYGPESDLLTSKIAECALTGIVRQLGVVPREVSLEKQRESQVLLLLKWEDPRTRGVYTAKVFEYLAAMRPILAVGGTNDVVTELLNETSAGVDAQTARDVEEAIKRFYQEYKLKGKVSYCGKIEKINKYSYREMAKRFAEILDLIA